MSYKTSMKVENNDLEGWLFEKNKCENIEDKLKETDKNMMW